MKKNERQDLVTNIYTADPSAHVFNGKIYIYPSHDEDLDIPEDDDGEQYVMKDYHILSMDSLDSECVDNGVALSEDQIPWVSRQLWAPDAIYTNGKYYLVFPAKDKQDIFRIGVAESDSPVGPFKPQENYIQGSYSIDPAVLKDDDGRIWCYNGGLWGGQLEMWQSGSFNPDEHRPEGDEKALGPLVAEFTPDMTAFKAAPKMITILDENGEPLKAGDEDRRYFEDPWMHKFNGKYYFSYSTGTTHYLCYAEGNSPEGPFTPSHTRAGSWNPSSAGQRITPSFRSTASGTSSTTMQRGQAAVHTREALSSRDSTSLLTARSRLSTLTTTRTLD